MLWLEIFAKVSQAIPVSGVVFFEIREALLNLGPKRSAIKQAVYELDDIATVSNLMESSRPQTLRTS